MKGYKQIAYVVLSFVCVLVLGTMVVLKTALAAGNGIEQSAADSTVTWKTYTDARFGFSIQYPAHWHIIPRDDNDPNAVSTVLTFTSDKPTEKETHSHDAVPHVVIGLHLAELEQDQSLHDWTALHKEASQVFDPDVVMQSAVQTRKIAGKDAVYVQGSSPLTDYQVVHIANEKTVWFIWANHNASEADPDTQLYTKMIDSFQFGRHTPTTLQDVYGDDFKPQKLGEPASQAANLPTFKDLFMVVPLPSPYMWHAPVTGSWNVQCGSGAHTGTAQYAADVGVNHRVVSAARTGSVSFAGWNNFGYGNLVKLQTTHGGTTYTHYYAHLSAIYKWSGTANTFDTLGISGDTGDSTGPHLHFHVRTPGDAVNLTGMNGFSPNGNYPTMSNVSCGSMGR